MSLPTARRTLLPGLLAVLVSLLAAAAHAQPNFTKVFQPDTIGPGGHSLLVFSIENPSGSLVTDLAFTDNLPAGVTLASPALPDTDCGPGVVTAPDGGGTITLSGGAVVGLATCTVSVQVTSSVLATHMSTSGNLTSSAGSSGTATDDLNVVADRPGFSKSFAPSTGPLGTRNTLTFTLDNSANGGSEGGATFTDTLPSGLVIADPSNASTDCLGAILTAPAGGDTISFSGGILLAGAICTATVDVVAEAPGNLHNVSSNLSASFQTSGFAVDTFTSTAGRLVLIKEFLDDPVMSGDQVDLQFRILNRDPSNAASNVAFTDDFDATLTGLTFDSVQSNSCGGTAAGTGTTFLTFSGGSLAARSECFLVVRLTVPGGAAAGGHLNTTSPVTADLDEPEVGNAATDTLFVTEAPSLTKTFLDNPTAGGNTVTLEFTVTNNSSTSAATNITFQDSLSFLSGITYLSGFQSNVCGAGSSFFLAAGDVLRLNSGNLAPSASCTFTADLAIPAGTPPGDYLNTTTALTATVDGTTQTGNAATDTLTVVAAPQLSKSFTDDPVLPGGTVTLEFTLTHDAAAPTDATGIAFTDDLNLVFSGLTATGLPMTDVCGVGSSLSGTTNLNFAGGTLAPGASCTFSVTLTVPAAALPGSFTNSTSPVTATVGGVTATGGIAQDDLLVSGLNLQKEFIDDPVIAGGTATLRFTIDNTNSAFDATGMAFTDSLTSALSGLNAVAPLPTEPCGLGSSISGTTTLVFTGGNLTAGTSCTFDVTVMVPAASPDGLYGNATSNLTATIDGSPVSLPPAADALEVLSEVIALTKTFTDDPVQPGEQVTLEFGLTNLSSEALTGISFTDDLGSALSGLSLSSTASDTCGFGISGTTNLSFSGGALAALGSCTVQLVLDVPPGASPGSYLNTTSSASGTSAVGSVTGPPASDTLRVVAVSFGKSFDGPTTAAGTAVLTFTLQNLDAGAGVGPLDFFDDLGAALPGLVATGLPMSDVCGSGSQISGTGFLTFSGGSLDPSETCTFDVTVQVPAGAAPGTYPNVSSALVSSGLEVAPAATADLVIEPPPTFAKVFAPGALGVGLTSTLTFTLDNTASALAASSLDFTDNLPAGTQVATPSNASTTCSGGTLTATAGSSVVSYTGGTVAAGASCTVTVDVQATAPGVHGNTTGDLTSSSGNSGTASDTLTVEPNPVFTKAFAPSAVALGGVSTLTFTIDNTGSASLDATGLDFTDNLPAGTQVATPSNASTTCTGGTLTAADGSSAIAYTGGSVAAGAGCTVSVEVEATAAGSHLNTSGDLTSSLGNSGPASDTLVGVTEELVLTKTFQSNPVLPGGFVDVVYTITNLSPSLTATGLTFTDDYDAALAGLAATTLPAAGSCGGGSTFSGTSVLTVSGAGLAPSGSCSFTVTLQVPAAAAAGSYPGATSPLSGDLGGVPLTTPAATDTLEVAYLGFTKSFAGEVTVGETVVLTFEITNPDPVNDATGLTFTDDLGAVLPGLAATGLPVNDVCGAGSQVTGTTVVQLVNGTVTAGASCTFDVTVEVPVDTPPGTYTNVTSVLEGDVGGSAVVANPAAATAPLVVTAPPLPIPVDAPWALVLLALLLGTAAIRHVRLG